METSKSFLIKFVAIQTYLPKHCMKNYYKKMLFYAFMGSYVVDDLIG